MSPDQAVAYALSDDDTMMTGTPPPSAHGGDELIVKLTNREQQVAELVRQGLSNKEIADRLVISQRTVEGHVNRSLVKLGFARRTQLAAGVTEQSETRDR